MSDTSLFPTDGGTLETVALHQLVDGQRADCFVLLAERQPATTRDGKPFFWVKFRDRHREVRQPIWSDSPWFEACQSKWKPGEFYKLRGTYRKDDRYGGSIEIEKIRPVRDEDKADGFDPADFQERTRFDVDQMFQELCELVRTEISNTALRKLVLKVLRQYESAIKVIPSATHNHHAYAGGFLEHTLSVARTCVYLAGKYAEHYGHVVPPPDQSLVVAGGILHDIGKVRELELRPDGGHYTIEGQLIGHILIGRDLVREAAAEVGELDPETLLRLEHIIVSHQNLPEWGSPKMPHTPEALIVHYADDLDAKLHMLMRALETDPGEEPFTSRQNAMRRNIYRGPTK